MRWLNWKCFSLFLNGAITVKSLCLILICRVLHSSKYGFWLMYLSTRISGDSVGLRVEQISEFYCCFCGFALTSTSSTHKYLLTCFLNIHCVVFADVWPSSVWCAAGFKMKWMHIFCGPLNIWKHLKLSFHLNCKWMSKFLPLKITQWPWICSIVLVCVCWGKPDAGYSLGPVYNKISQ